MHELSGYREVFIEELVEQIEQMERDLLALEKEPSDRIIQSVFRAAHTIKGSSAAMGLDSLSMLTHEMEHLLDKARSKKIQAGSRLLNVLFRTLDGIKMLKDQYMEDAGPGDVAGLTAMLRSFDASEADEAGGSGAACSVWKLTIRLAYECDMKEARAMLIEKEIGEQFGTVVPTDSSSRLLGTGDAGLLELLLQTAHTPETIRTKVADMTDVESVQVEAWQAAEPAPAAAAALVQAAAGETPQRAEPAEVSVSQDAKQKGPQTIRVSVERLEHLMNLVGELLIDQTSLVQLKQSLLSRYAKEDFVSRLGEVTDHMHHIVEELQDCVMKARMLPIEHLFNRFPRMVRDLSQQLGKEIHLILEGTETELDRTLIEEITDPLIHLIRNAVDHGIEPAEARRAKGKPAKGQVRLSSFHEDNQVVITLEDDGAGIDPQRIKASAIRKGIITAEEGEKLSEQEIIHLIFRPGFSTAASVSEVSGRGVGMDIVRNQIERLNGIVQVKTELHKGTCFTVRLPLTLAIITGLMVKVSGREFVIPMNNVLEIVRYPADDIPRIQGNQMLTIRDQVLPLVWLQDALGVPKSGTRKYLPVVIIGSAEKKVALAVDDLLGNQEVVVKTLGSYLGKIPYTMGSTILGNGQVALILDVSYLVQRSARTAGRSG